MFYNYDDMQFSVGGNNNGVITLTTPTLTPTTMRNIEQSILDSTPYVENHEEAGSFIPPLPTCINLVTSNWQGGSISTKQEPVETYEEDLKVQSSKKTKGGKMGKGNKNGGRRPRMDKNISPEEEERRRLRRERNKLAAARCRKRRVDHTNSLVEETQCLESKKNRLQDQITRLQQEREELEFILSAHNPNCTKGNNGNNNNNNNSGSGGGGGSNNTGSVGVGIGGGGPAINVNNNLNNSNNLNHVVVGMNKPKRPTSLPVAVVKQESLVTPSTGLDLDWSTLPSTGLTPNFTPITPSVNLLSLMDEDPKSSNKKNNLVQL